MAPGSSPDKVEASRSCEAQRISTLGQRVHMARRLDNSSEPPSEAVSIVMADSRYRQPGMAGDAYDALVHHQYPLTADNIHYDTLNTDCSAPGNMC